jgi:hypothetical protein
MQHRWEEIYRQKLCSADDCAKLLRDGDFIFAPPWPMASPRPLARPSLKECARTA